MTFYYQDPNLDMNKPYQIDAGKRGGLVLGLNPRLELYSNHFWNNYAQVGKGK